MSHLVVRVDGSDHDFLSLVRELDRFLAEINGEQDGFYSQFNKVDTLAHVVVAYANEVPVGCGAFRRLDDGTVEIKRMFVAPTARKQGIARLVLAELETWAAELGASRAILETSKRLDSAVALYKASAYEVIDNYGQYIGVEDSVCLAKTLA